VLADAHRDQPSDRVRGLGRANAYGNVVEDAIANGPAVEQAMVTDERGRHAYRSYFDSNLH